MKLFFRKLLPFLLAAVLVASACLFAACGNDDGSSAESPSEPETGSGTTIVQQLDYTENTEKIDNPDQGFYHPIYVKATENGVSYNANIVTAETRLYHLRIDISAFSANGGGEDKALTPSALQGIRDLLSFLREKDKNAVVRFAYDPGFGGKANAEPDTALLLSHAEQFCAVLNEYPVTITALEAGMIGPWGEMHTSTIAKPENISALIQVLLTNTTDIPVLVRTPKMIYDYLGAPTDTLDEYRIPDSAYRLGIFNDGYLGSSTDLGTYTNRTRDVAFVSRQTAHLPYGGEVVTPSSEYHNIETCLSEMYQINLSYLNVEWDYNVINKWKDSTVTAACADAASGYYGESAFTYIQNHMGYRFVLRNSTFTISDSFDSLKIDLTLENVGFGNLNRQKTAKLIFTDENGKVVSEQSVTGFSGENRISYSLPIDLPSGTYGVYLQLYGDTLNGSTLYNLQFANNGIYDSELQANKIGRLEI